MKILHILIVEDEMMVAMNLEMMQATVVIEASVAATKKVSHEDIDFAM